MQKEEKMTPKIQQSLSQEQSVQVIRDISQTKELDKNSSMNATLSNITANQNNNSTLNAQSKLIAEPTEKSASTSSTQEHISKPPKKCSCRNAYVPVCSYSGKTYDNFCLLVCNDEFIKHDGPCKMTQPTLKPEETPTPKLEAPPAAKHDALSMPKLEAPPAQKLETQPVQKTEILPETKPETIPKPQPETPPAPKIQLVHTSNSDTAPVPKLETATEQKKEVLAEPNQTILSSSKFEKLPESTTEPIAALKSELLPSPESKAHSINELKSQHQTKLIDAPLNEHPKENNSRKQDKTSNSISRVSRATNEVSNKSKSKPVIQKITDTIKPFPACRCSERYIPVCGADGHEYQNACTALCYGAIIASWGNCNTALVDHNDDQKNKKQIESVKPQTTLMRPNDDASVNESSKSKDGVFFITPTQPSKSVELTVEKRTDRTDQFSRKRI